MTHSSSTGFQRNSDIFGGPFLRLGVGSFRFTGFLIAILGILCFKFVKYQITPVFLYNLFLVKFHLITILVYSLLLVFFKKRTAWRPMICWSFAKFLLQAFQRDGNVKRNPCFPDLAIARCILKSGIRRRINVLKRIDYTPSAFPIARNMT